MSASLQEQLSSLPLPRLTTVLRVNIAIGHSPQDFLSACRLIEDWWNHKANPYEVQIDPSMADFSFGRSGFSAEFARSVDQFALSMEEPDSTVSGRAWICEIALHHQDEKTDLGFRLSFRQPLNSQHQRPLPRAPKFFREIVDNLGASDTWPVLSLPQHIDRENLPFLCDFITSETRRLPVVAISEETPSGHRYVDADALARLLVGTAHVITLDPGASWQLTSDWGNDWSTFQGAVRCYNPGFSRSANKFSHRLWLPHSIERLDASSRNGFLNTCAAHVFTIDTATFESRPLLTPPAVRRLLEQEKISRLSSTAPPILDSPATSSHEALEFAEREAATSDVLLIETQKAYQELELRVARAEEQVRSSEEALQAERAARADNELLLDTYKEANEELEQRNKRAMGDSSSESSPVLRSLWEGFSVLFNSAQNVATRLRRLEMDSDQLAQALLERDEAKQEIANLRATAESLSRRTLANPCNRDEIVALIPEISSRNPSLVSSLRFVQGLFPERVVILQSAFTSAENSEDFRFGQAAFNLLWTLVECYWQRIQDAGDIEARKCFGASSFAAREKRTLSKSGKELRTFTYNGIELFMEKHLKMGTADNFADTLRIHFDWLPDERKIIIGHCGGHLDF